MSKQCGQRHEVNSGLRSPRRERMPTGIEPERIQLGSLYRAPVSVIQLHNRLARVPAASSTGKEVIAFGLSDSLFEYGTRSRRQREFTPRRLRLPEGDGEIAILKVDVLAPQPKDFFGPRASVSNISVATSCNG
jgi:hypothetical protein